MEGHHKLPQYSYYISWSPEDKEFVATFVEIPELSGLGPTLTEAVKELRDVFIGWLETAKDKGFELPKPDLPPVNSFSFLMPGQANGLSFFFARRI